MNTFECDICHKQCRFLSYLNRHKKIHSSFPTEYECKICSNEITPMFFRNTRAYKSHLKYAHEINESCTKQTRRMNDKIKTLDMSKLDIYVKEFFNCVK